MIAYTKTFRERVAGALKARFLLDSSGNPLFEPDADEPSLRHYRIELSLESPKAEQIELVTYELDEATYYDPVRESRNRKVAFREEIHSYGDFPITVKVQMSGQLYLQDAWLSDLLQAGHAGDGNRVVQAAIDSIKTN